MQETRSNQHDTTPDATVSVARDTLLALLMVRDVQHSAGESVCQTELLHCTNNNPAPTIPTTHRHVEVGYITKRWRQEVRIFGCHFCLIYHGGFFSVIELEEQSFIYLSLQS